MRWRGSTGKLTAGLEISSGLIRYALLQKKGTEQVLQKMADVNIPSDALVPSLKSENILDMAAVQNSLRQAGRMIPTKVIHTVLPDACTRTVIRKFRELPRDNREIHNLVLWNMAEACNLPIEKLRISWTRMGKTSDNEHVFLVVMGMAPVIAQYETALSAAGICPASLAPAGLSRFNFFAPALPETGNIALLSLFDAEVHLLVFSNGLPLFCRMIRKGLVNTDSTSAIEDVNLLVHCYDGEFPGHAVDTFFIVSPVKYQGGMEQVFQEPGNTQLVTLDETDFIQLDDGIRLTPQNNPLPFFAAVLGAATRQMPGN